MIEEKLPDITDFARVYQGVEPITEPVPIQPTAHYAMGGIPTDLHARVTRDAAGTVVPGLYAAGESACVSRPRREPAGHELARRPAGLRPPRRPPDGRGRQGRRHARRRRDVEEPVRGRDRGAPRPHSPGSGRPDPHGPGRRDDGRRRRLPRRDAPAGAPSATVERAAGPLLAGRRRTTRARSSTRTCSRRARSATCSTAPRRPSPRRWPARRAAAPTPARTTPSATTSTSSAHSLATKRDGAIQLTYKPVTITTFQPKPRIY